MDDGKFFWNVVLFRMAWRVILGQHGVKRSLSEIETSSEGELRDFLFRSGLRSEKNQNFQGHEGFEIARTDINRRFKRPYLGKVQQELKLTQIHRSSVNDFYP